MRRAYILSMTRAYVNGFRKTYDKISNPNTSLIDPICSCKIHRNTPIHPHQIFSNHLDCSDCHMVYIIDH